MWVIKTDRGLLMGSNYMLVVDLAVLWQKPKQRREGEGIGCLWVELLWPQLKTNSSFVIMHLNENKYVKIKGSSVACFLSAS